MNLLLTEGNLYLDQQFFCYAEAGHGRTHLPPGRYPVRPQYDAASGYDLPYAAGLGTLGAEPGSGIVLGRVRGQHVLLPCALAVGRLLSRVESALAAGQDVMLEVA